MKDWAQPKDRSVMISVRMKRSELQCLEERALELGCTRSDVIKAAITNEVHHE